MNEEEMSEEEMSEEELLEELFDISNEQIKEIKDKIDDIYAGWYPNLLELNIIEENENKKGINIAKIILIIQKKYSEKYTTILNIDLTDIQDYLGMSLEDYCKLKQLARRYRSNYKRANSNEKHMYSDSKTLNKN